MATMVTQKQVNITLYDLKLQAGGLD